MNLATWTLDAWLAVSFNLPVYQAVAGLEGQHHHPFRPSFCGESWADSNRRGPIRYGPTAPKFIEGVNRQSPPSSPSSTPARKAPWVRPKCFTVAISLGSIQRTVRPRVRGSGRVRNASASRASSYSTPGNGNSIRPTGRSSRGALSATSKASIRLPSGTYPTTANVPMLACLHLSQVDDGPEV